MNSLHAALQRRTSPRSRSLLRGSIAVYCAIAALVIIGVMGLVLDTAWVMTAKSQLQCTADAAALAGASKLSVPGQVDYAAVRQAAHDAALANSAANRQVVLGLNAANDPAGDIVVGSWSECTSTFQATDPATGLPSPDSVEVQARLAAGSSNAPLGLFFGPIFGVNDSNVGRTAVARQGGSSSSLVLVLEPSANKTLSMSGGSLTVPGATITLNSSAVCALQMSGSATITAAKIRVAGTACVDHPLNITGQLIQGSSPEADPLASLPEPTYDSSSPLPAITGSGTYNPGYYPGGINLGSGTAVLNPGVYVLGNQNPGKGVTVNGSSSLLGTGVTLFFLNGADFTVGGGTVQLSAPATGTYAGVGVFFARGSPRQMKFNGSSFFDLKGTVYLPAGNFILTGGGSRSFGRLIARDVDISGGGTIDGEGVAGAGGGTGTTLSLVY